MDKGLIHIWNNFTDKLYNYVEELVRNEQEIDNTKESEEEDKLTKAVIDQDIEGLIDISIEMKSLGQKPEEPINLLNHLAQRGDLEFLKLFQKTWANLWDQDWTNHILQQSLINRKKDLVEYLLKQQGDPTNKDSHQALKYFINNKSINQKERLRFIKEIINIYPEKSIREIANSSPCSPTSNYPKEVIQIAKEHINKEVQRYGGPIGSINSPQID